MKTPLRKTDAAKAMPNEMSGAYAHEKHSFTIAAVDEQADGRLISRSSEVAAPEHNILAAKSALANCSKKRYLPEGGTHKP